MLFCHCEISTHVETKQFQKLMIMINKKYYVYIITNKWNTTFYVGITSNLIKRIYQRKNKLADGFSKRYNLTKLVYYEQFENPEEAIIREKQLKAGSRKKKTDLIEKDNPDFNDLYDNISH